MTTGRRLTLGVAIVLPTLAVAAGFVRLLQGWEFLGPLALAALGGHTVAALTRRWRGVLGDAAVLVAGALAVVWVVLPQTTWFGWPTRRTAHAVSAEVSLAWDHFAAEAAPAPARTGYVLLAFVALWLVAWAADRLVFRYRTPAEAVLPSATVFVFVTLLTGPRLRLASTLAYGAGVGLFALGTRLARRPIALPRLAGAGVATVAVALGVSALAVTTVPGADGPGAVEVRNLGRDRSNRTVVSPLVDIRRRLLEQDDISLFTVRSEQPSYWRLMALDDFDGSVWSSSQTFRDAGRRLGRQRSTAPHVPVLQTYTITSLDQPWAPAAYEARSIQGSDHLLWDEASSTLIVDRRQRSVAGLHYSVVSEVPDPSPDALRRATGPIPDDIARRDLDLPADFPDEVVRVARAVTRDGRTEYDRAKLLQDWFRSTFRYSTDVPPGQSSQAIVSFLRSRVGYCEQFAGSFAAMARSIGMPARVVVGFTPGRPDPANPGTYEVMGRNAHAWPEVYLPGPGWTAFEPTPGRGDPQATRHTGVPPEQAGPGSTPVPAPTTPSTAPGSTPGTTAATPGSTAAPGPGPSPSADSLLPTTPRRGGVDPWIAWPVGVAAAALLAAGASAAVTAERRRRRHASARGPAGSVLAAWADVTASAASMGVWPAPHETYREVAARLSPALADPVAAAAAARLAETAALAAWSPGDVDAGQARTAAADARALEDRIGALIGRRGRLLARLDPRTPARRAARRAAGAGRGAAPTSRPAAVQT